MSRVLPEETAGFWLVVCMYEVKTHPLREKPVNFEGPDELTLNRKKPTQD